MKTIILSGAVALVIALLGTPLFIRLMRRHGYGQPIRVEGLKSHETKRGTPTMGGVIFVIAAVVGYVTAHVATDDRVDSVRRADAPDDDGPRPRRVHRRFPEDLPADQRGTAQPREAGRPGRRRGRVRAEVLQHPDGFDLTPADAHLSFLRDFGPAIGTLPFVIWAVIMVVGTSNAVNLSDGLDGLATGATVLVLAAYVVIGIWQERNDCANFIAPQCYQVRDPLDLAVVAAAVLGACIGYLWWNAPPAKIIMGDTGSLASGGALAGLAICTKTQLLLLILGGLFVIITLSDVIQVTVFKVTRIRTGRGKRVFKMAPLQHHFELRGWADTTIVIRFWLISGLCVALGLGIFYAAWLQT